jgi:hypothetical protein
MLVSSILLNVLANLAASPSSPSVSVSLAGLGWITGTGEFEVPVPDGVKTMIGDNTSS